VGRILESLGRELVTREAKDPRSALWLLSGIFDLALLDFFRRLRI
jgi:hypothetical protein